MSEGKMSKFCTNLACGGGTSETRVFSIVPSDCDHARDNLMVQLQCKYGHQHSGYQGSSLQTNTEIKSNFTLKQHKTNVKSSFNEENSETIIV